MRFKTSVSSSASLEMVGRASQFSREFEVVFFQLLLLLLLIDNDDEGDNE